MRTQASLSRLRCEISSQENPTPSGADGGITGENKMVAKKKPAAKKAAKAPAKVVKKATKKSK